MFTHTHSATYNNTAILDQTETHKNELILRAIHYQTYIDPLTQTHTHTDRQRHTDTDTHRKYHSNSDTPMQTYTGP